MMNRASEMTNLIAALADVYQAETRLRELDDALSVNLDEQADQTRAWAWREADKRDALFNLLLMMPHNDYLRLLGAIGED